MFTDKNVSMNRRSINILELMKTIERPPYESNSQYRFILNEEYLKNKFNLNTALLSNKFKRITTETFYSYYTMSSSQVKSLQPIIDGDPYSSIWKLTPMEREQAKDAEFTLSVADKNFRIKPKGSEEESLIILITKNNDTSVRVNLNHENEIVVDEIVEIAQTIVISSRARNKSNSLLNHILKIADKSWALKYATVTKLLADIIKYVKEINEHAILELKEEAWVSSASILTKFEALLDELERDNLTINIDQLTNKLYYVAELLDSLVADTLHYELFRAKHIEKLNELKLSKSSIF